MSIYCTPDCCSLEANCMNARRTLSTIKLFDTVCAKTQLWWKDNPRKRSNKTGVQDENTPSGKYVYIEALKCGPMTIIMSHACDPNMKFIETQNRTTVKVLSVMIKNVKEGTQFTINYGEETWFRCACDICWTEEDE
ncbi:Set domain-containing hypothetical protein [Phytophthora megakarya]|uniref:SET domain-containing protein n=1 Tax=Phytophthora megakarya TaxID=4795 RepID=A0A225WVR5_9STRA|nr:Set domain-containing hypothetical protein [Phytophthora megakarya]